MPPPICCPTATWRSRARNPTRSLVGQTGSGKETLNSVKPQSQHLKGAEAARGQERARGLGADRSAGCGTGEGQARQGGAWRIRERVPRLLRGAGHVLRRHLKGVGRVYQQTAIDTYSKVAFAKLYDRKTPLTAADLMNDRVVPFFDEHEIAVSRVSPTAALSSAASRTTTSTSSTFSSTVGFAK
jgi:hypothetical protein